MRLVNPHYPNAQGALITPPNEGITLARGTSVPSAVAGYRAYGLFIGPDGIYQNEGSITSCSFVKLVGAAPAAADVTVEDSGTFYTGTDVEAVLAEIGTLLFDTVLGQGTALTADLTGITHTAPNTPDYAIQALTDSGGFGFATADEGHTVLAVIANLQTRVAELEAVLDDAGFFAA